MCGEAPVPAESEHAHIDWHMEPMVGPTRCPYCSTYMGLARSTFINACQALAPTSIGSSASVASSVIAASPMGMGDRGGSMGEHRRAAALRRLSMLP